MSLVAVITGASSGIGAATSRRLAREPGAQLVLVARREQRLRDLAGELGATYIAADLTDGDAPARVAAHVAEHHGRLTLLVNNAGASWRASFADGGYANVRETMAVNFDAVIRLTEALLPLVRASRPSAIVNIASTAARVARPGAGAYSASKFALAGWTDALHLEERPHGVHVGLVLPGFIATERGRAERYVSHPYALAAAARILAPVLVRRLQASRAGSLMTTRTNPDAAPEMSGDATGPEAARV
jgi:short-subunit dehydrogenase